MWVAFHCNFRRQTSAIGFSLATKAGLSIAVDDMLIPGQKPRFWSMLKREVKEIEQQFASGLVTQGERYNKVVDIWGRAGDQVGKAMMDSLEAILFRTARVIKLNKSPSIPFT